MGNTDDMVTILGLFGLGYLIYKSAKTYQKTISWVESEVLEPIERLRSGTSSHYSPYSQRYFSPTHSREGSLWAKMLGS